MAGCNEENCLCPHKECKNHGKCCDCVRSHRDRQHNLPMCLRIMLEKLKEEEEAKAGA